MAYNRPYNPDELPRFAEPESKGSNQKLPSPSQASPQFHQPQHPQSRYENKPVPPRPDQRPLGSATQQRPPVTSRPPPSPAPPETKDGNDPTLRPLFRAVDKDGTGQLSEKELSAALVNGDWTAFDPHTVRMMIRMFDADRSGTIGFDEFCGLWSFLASWRTLFDRFDTDRSGNIQLEEFRNALVAFRYRLSDRFTELLFRTYDKRGEGSMSFDLFVQSCISLKRMTDVFKRYDDDRDGYITLSFEDFLTEILKQLK
ncbi:hypothetical protein MCOR27_008697 [Pyricularia oryzae]|uniref:EF-hand domain-containing protein n=5 Tax=Pyricularia TaxID=48558 RepID=A0ABQ8N8I9_PYRGI|nr:sorcin [Pyricularia oryzae 70-15]ELQ42713.1 sorcin [Pyricularia oryzae Y34]KAH8837331.1 hypothetical protein MCOR01_010962 [Pyricularia oryzae]KAI6293004.1 hypothetical protein MCOR33_009458 [Pyricularia grisea]EHA53941.1 sorcin [Pyricularia oryzae 70-15]KAH9437994.1 hypothetical protein MCOR02_001633 [Pyricularia oryzae]